MRLPKVESVIFSVFMIGWTGPSYGVTSGQSYRIISTCGSGGSVMDISGGSLNNYASVIVAPKDLTKKSQVFKIESVGRAYKFTNQNSGKVLDVLGKSMASGDSIDQYTYGGTTNQLFQIESPASGIYRFKNVNSGLYIDLKGASTAAGNAFDQYTSNTTCAQRYKLEAVVSPSPSPSSSPSPSPKPSPSPSASPSSSPSPTSSSLITDHVFAPSSFWYTAIPTNVALDPNSANMVNDFVQQKANYYGTVNVNTDAYSSPVYMADSNAPTVKVSQWDCQNKGYFDSGLATQWAQVPVPAGAVPSAGTDMEMTVYQPSTNTIWEFWQMRNSNGSWQACWGGRMQNATQNQGIFANPYGTTATGLPFLGGQITAEELERGEIRHAIGIALVHNSRTISWPATRSDGDGAGLIAEGQRLRLNPSINVDALNISPAAKVIAKAAQKYGFVVWDKAGSISVRAQNVVSYPSDPYHTRLFGGLQDYQVLNGFPWNQLQFLPVNYGQP